MYTICMAEEEKVPQETAEEETSLEERDYSDEILQIIRTAGSDEQFRKELENYHDNDIAAVLDRLTAPERKRLYAVLGNDAMSDIFAYCDDMSRYIEELGADKAADIIENMDADDAIDVLDELDDDKREQLLGLMEPQAKEDIELIHSYEPDEFGSVMTTNFVAIEKNQSVAAAMKELIRQAADNDNISTLYVLNQDGSFYGAIDLKELIIARKDTPLSSLIITSYPYVYDHESISESTEKLREYSEDSIPVLDDDDNRLLGVITAQDIVELVDDQMSEDYAKLAGLTECEDMEEPLVQSVQKRIPWLVILLFLGLAVSSVVGAFENVVHQLTLIVCFQSLILGMAGNVGTQSLAVTVRVLSDEALAGKRSARLIFKEVRVGFLNGLLLGTFSFLLIGLYILLLKGKPPLFAFATSGCAGMALWAAMTISSFTGTMIPLTLKKCGVDPAVASGPLISTVNDLVAVVTYYGLAWLLLIKGMNLIGL